MIRLRLATARQVVEGSSKARRRQAGANSGRAVSFYSHQPELAAKEFRGEAKCI